MQTATPVGRSSTSRSGAPQPLGEEPRPWVVVAAVDHLDDRPTAPLERTRRDHERRSLAEHHGRARRNQHHRRAVATAALDHHVDCRPGRRPLLAVRLVVGVEDHGGPQPRDGRPGRHSCTHRHRATGGRPLPPVGQQRHRHTPTSQPRLDGGGPPVGRSEDEHPVRTGPMHAAPRPGARRRVREAVAPPLAGPDARAASTSSTAPPPGEGGCTAVRAGDGKARTTRSGEAVPRKEEMGPAQRQAAHSASRTTAGGGPMPLERASGLATTPGVGATPSSVTQPPTRRPWSSTRTRLPVVMRSASRGRHRVVEGAPNGRHVGHHPDQPLG